MTYININEIKDNKLKEALKQVEWHILHNTCEECEMSVLCDQLPQCTCLCEILCKGA